MILFHLFLKVYTVANESVLAQHIPFSRLKLKEYDHVDIPHSKFESLANDLERLKKRVCFFLGFDYIQLYFFDVFE